MPYQFSRSPEESPSMKETDLYAGPWASEHIRGYAHALARCGYHELLTRLMQRVVLHEIREHSPAGRLLWAAYNVCAGLPDIAECALRDALCEWPEDALLVDFMESGLMRL